LATSWPVAMNIAVMPFGECAAVVVGAREERADVRDVRVVGQALGLDAHVLDEHVARHDRLGRDALAARAHDVDLAGLLVGREVRLEVELPHVSTCSRIQLQAAKVARPTMFWPAASPVE
jgi:hypothetical protein